MIVGREVLLSADITFCDRLVIAGNVEASLHECRELEISGTGVFKGNAKVANAE
jgi:cytoskeletal protein CcmA (bactofilin family)